MFEALYHTLSEMGFTHPLHPTQINMPIGLVVGALVFALAALWLRRSRLATAARYCFILALLFWVSTVFAGVIDWQHFHGGVWLFPIKVKVGLAGFLFLLLLLGILVGQKSEGITAPLLLIYVIGFFTVVGLGYFGAELVFGGRAPKISAQHSAGENSFRVNCSGCHPFGGNRMMPSMPVIASHRLEDYSAFLGWIRNPTPPMPGFPKEDIPEAQARALYDYLTYLWASSGGGHENHIHEEKGHQHGS